MVQQIKHFFYKINTFQRLVLAEPSIYSDMWPLSLLTNTVASFHIDKLQRERFKPMPAELARESQANTFAA